MINVTTKSPDSIQNYLNQCKTYGGGTVLLAPGTYNLTDNIYIPSGVILEGESRDNCIIECGDFSVIIEGEDVYDTGTVAINTADTTLVGTGTTFTADMVGQKVLLEGYWYEITTFTDTTHLEIEAYEGDNITGYALVIATVNSNATVKNLTIQLSTVQGLIIRYTIESVVHNVNIYDCDTGLDMDYAVFPTLRGTFDFNNTNCDMNFVEGFSIDFTEFSYSLVGAGLVMANTRNCTYFNTSSNFNATDGITMTNCSKITFVSFDISWNGASGIEMTTDCNDNQIGQGTIDFNTSDGIKLTATSDNNIMSSLTAKNNGVYGVNIAAATCDNNILMGVVATNNGTGGLLDSGTGTLKSTTVNILA